MRLKRLELHGYKTFATRTAFAFDDGITAIIGPNGSGKSNCADAIRWVLGEQSYRVLRGKSTEDMIFAGSAQRARLGMASASLTFDNGDGWLPVDFGEVTLTRRAYRSGENEYLLNGSRVRLRDINELLAKSGLARRTYTVIGQGLVDAVLSLRPDERRTLFEEAAGITLYQSKRADALARLEETHSNLLRVNDIVNEIVPLLRRLEREAERAERHALLSQELDGLLRTWYGYRWHHEQLELRRTRDALARRQEVLARRRAALDALDVRTAELRARHGELRKQLAGWRQEGGDLQRQREEVQRNLAVWQERTRLLAGQAVELSAEVAAIESQAGSMAERIAMVEREVGDCQAALQDHEAQVGRMQGEMDALEGRRTDLARRLAGAQSRVLEVAGQATDARNRLGQIDERRGTLAGDRTAHQEAAAAHESQSGELGRQMEALAVQQAQVQAEEKALMAEGARLEAALVETQSRQAELRTALSEAQRRAERLQARSDLLARLRAEGEGLHAGVRAVLAVSGEAARGAEHGTQVTLSGILGTVAQLVQVPAEYEVAIEVALGGHVQDIVVESWSEAEAAVAYLKAGERGRATFLPLDTVRSGSRVGVPNDLKGAVVGVAADLVTAEVRLAPAVEMLLGRTVVVGELKAARRVFERLVGGFTIVTLAGELLRSSGALTGGQGRDQAHGQVLAREREWRDLPGHLAAAMAHSRELEAGLADAEAAEQQVRTQAAGLEVKRREKRSAATVLEAQQGGLDRDRQHLLQQTAWRRELVTRLDAEAADLDAREAKLRTSLAQLADEAQAAEAQVSAAQGALDGVRGDLLYQQLSDARTAAAVARETWEHRRAALADHQRAQSQLVGQAGAKKKRIADLDVEQAHLGEQIHTWTARQSVVHGWLAALAQKTEPAETEMATVEVELEKLEQEETATRARLREAESSYGQATLTLNQQQDHLHRLRRQLVEDFGLAPTALEPAEGEVDQLRLPLGDDLAPLPVVEELPEGLEEEIQYVRGQTRRIGPFNPNAPAEHAEVQERYMFLTAQATDLEEATRSLREVIAELDEVMRREFHSTFKEVAARFKENFGRMFGGGSARLTLTDPDDISITGIEISAQPPGKRPQTLALLSGGERALTAVSLIFSILEVNPPPFCILDEVDAMLDEANVGRFRQALEALNRHTQFIVITHNRGTIQAANTIYGVSMGEDSVSQVVSLRLEGERIAAPDGSSVEVGDR
jgi:chromosome segregation protein